MTQQLYDPRAHADEMRVRIIYHSLKDMYGAWNPVRRTILLDRQIPPGFETAILAHECVHAEHNDPGGHHPRHERRAHLNSARRLINVDEWDKQTAMHGDYDRICGEFGITRQQFLAFRDFRKRQLASDARMERIGDAVYVNPKMGSGQWAMKLEVA